MRKILLRNAALACSIALLSGSMNAQVTLSCLELRDVVNAIVPGLVDANGQFDPQDPAIGQVTELALYLQYDATEDLVGIEHFYGLEFLRVSFIGTGSATDSLFIPSLPSGLERFEFYTAAGYSAIGVLPDAMDLVEIDIDYLIDGIVHIEQIGQDLGGLYIGCGGNISWGDTAHVSVLSLGHSMCPVQGITVSPVECDLFVLEQLGGEMLVQGDLDLSNVRCQELRFGGAYVLGGGTIFWPEHVPMMNLTRYYYLPAWPQSVDSISFLEDQSLHCIPPFPSNLRYLEMNGSFTGCIPNWPDQLDHFTIGGQLTQFGDVNFCSVLNSACPGSYPGIGGNVIHDLNGNGLFDIGEIGLPQTSVTVQPNGYMTSCAADGSWAIGVPPGSYSINTSSSYPYIQSIIPNEHSANVLNMGDTDVDNDFAVTLIPDIQDLRVSLYADPARPGFDNQVYLRCENYGTTVVDAELTLTFDADQTWLSSSVAPSNTASNTATWNFPAMPIGAVQNIVVGLNAAASVALGTEITHTLTADPVATDVTPLNNSYTFNDTVVGSYDPNDKLLSPAVLTPDEVALGETPIEYTIRFQNTGTYLAERVVILDTLSTDLQWESMRFLDSSHPNHWYVVDGVLHVIHNDINLPDSTSDEANSHGFVRFSILPRTDLWDGTTITNIAHIVFDFNEPIITPPAIFSVDIAASVAEQRGSSFNIHPNPVHDRLWIYLPDAQKTVINYRISDMLGKVVLNGASTNGSVDVQELGPGLYTFVIDHPATPSSIQFMKD